MSKFEIPQVLSGERTEDENYNAAYRAAHKHGKHLTKANADLIVAYDLAKTLKTRWTHHTATWASRRRPLSGR